MPAFHIEEEITLRTWGDIFNRPGYQYSVEAGHFRFLHFAAAYSFKAQCARCGLSECQQVHSRGFLVITSDKKEANLCEACGQRLLGMRFNHSIIVPQDPARVRGRNIRLNKSLEDSDVIKARAKRSQLALPDVNHVS